MRVESAARGEESPGGSRHRTLSRLRGDTSVSEQMRVESAARGEESPGGSRPGGYPHGVKRGDVPTSGAKTFTKA